MAQQHGTVKFFNQEKGFGFIQTEEGDIFVHANQVSGNPLQEGDEVAFDLAFDEVKQKSNANNVTGGTGQKGYFGGGKGKGGGKGFGGKGSYGGGYEQERW